MQKGSVVIFILIGILVLAGVAGGAYYFGKSQTPKPQPQNQVVASQTPQQTVVPQATPSDETANWKTYNSYESDFSMQYPPNWTVKDRSQEIGRATNRFEGPEGYVDISFGKGFGGGCDTKYHVQIQVFGSTQDVCDIKNPDDTENFSGIFKEISTQTSFAAGGTVNVPVETNRQIILKIFSTFKFTN